MKLIEYNKGIIYGFDITGGETLVQIGLPIGADVTTMQDVYLIPAPVCEATDAVVQALRTALKYSWHPTLNVKTTAIKSIAVAMLKDCEEDREKAQAALTALDKGAK